MEYDGLAVRYPVNRPLTEEERSLRVEASVSASDTPSATFSLIAQSPLYVELVDKYYAWKGMLAALFLAPLIGFVWLMATLPSAFMQGLQKTPESDRWIGWVAGAFGAALFAFIVGLLLWAVLRESFTLTHFPVRLNRQNGMVYVFRPKRRPDILRVRWDEVYWHVRHNKNRQFGGHNWFLAGHVMAKDRKTVLETFSLGRVGGRPEDIHPLWEYVRRFMEKGPDAVPAPQFYLPLVGRREGFWWGAQTLLLNAPGSLAAAVLLLPFTAPATIGRWLCMLTNRVPEWPGDIQRECNDAEVQRQPPQAEAKPEYGKLVVLLLVGLLIDSAIGVWVYSISPFAK